MLRQFLRKGTELPIASQTLFNDISRLLNRRPRKTPGWKTPEVAMAEELENFHHIVLHLDLEAAK